MALGTWTIYDELFHTGVDEVVADYFDVFNASTANAIRLISRPRLGNYKRESFFKLDDGSVFDRDPNADAPLTPNNHEMPEIVGVKVYKGITPQTQQRTAFREVGMDPETLALSLGRQSGGLMMRQMAYSAINSVNAAIGAQPLLSTDVSSGATLAHDNLNVAASKLGDQSRRIVCWVTHSKSGHDLLGDNISQYKIDSIAGVQIVQGPVLASLGRPVVMIDAPSLMLTVPTRYITLGLVMDGVTVEEGVRDVAFEDDMTGNTNIKMQWQAEWDYVVNCKGSAWDITNGGAAPTETALGTTTNWDQIVGNIKDMAGVQLITD